MLSNQLCTFRRANGQTLLLLPVFFLGSFLLQITYEMQTHPLYTEHSNLSTRLLSSIDYLISYRSDKLLLVLASTIILASSPEGLMTVF
jgi:hypothetical protein